METSMFYIRLWRANALIIFGTGVLAFAVGLFGVKEIASQIFRDRSVHNRAVATAAPGETRSQPRLAIGGFASTEAGDYLYGALGSTENRAISGPYSKSGSATRNIIVLNPKAGTAHAVFETSGQVVLHYVTPVVGSGDTRATAGILAMVVPSDTNADGDLDNRDAQQLVMASADGQGVATLMDGLTAHHVLQAQSNGSIVAVVSHATRGPRLLTIDAKARKILTDTAIPMPPVK